MNNFRRVFAQTLELTVKPLNGVKITMAYGIEGFWNYDPELVTFHSIINQLTSKIVLNYVFDVEIRKLNLKTMRRKK